MNKVYYLILLVSVLLLSGCAGKQTSELTSCQQACSTQMVEIYKKGLLTCKCRIVESNENSKTENY